MKNSFVDYIVQKNPHSIITYSWCQDALAFLEEKIAQICSEESLILLLLFLWDLINELVLREPSKQLFPVSWNKSSVRRTYSGETNFFLFLRKITPELTAANPPLFVGENWP